MVLLMGKPIARVVLRFLFGGQGNWYRDGYTNLMIPVSRVSIEHVVPRSLLPKKMVWDLNNLLIVDKGLNNYRSNTKFGRSTLRGVTFCPAENKGQIARICAHMIDSCNGTSYSESASSVIDPFLMEEWSREYPVTDHEKYINNYIYDIQGTYNEYVDGKEIYIMPDNFGKD